MAALGIVLYGNVGYGTPAVVAGHVEGVEEQVGLHGEQLATGKNGVERLGGEDGGNRFYRLYGLNGRYGFNGLGGLNGLDGGYGLDGYCGHGEGLCRLGSILAEHDDEARGAQLWEVGVEQPLPEPAALLGHELLLQTGQVAVEEAVTETLHGGVVGVVGTAHEEAERAVVLDGVIHGEHVVAQRETQVIGEELEQCLYALASQAAVQVYAAFGRGSTTHHHADKLQAVAVDLGDDSGAQLVEQVIVLRQPAHRHREGDAGGMVEELLVGEGGVGFVIINYIYVRVLIIER